ncbi:MAG: WXG100 family type VII secretion target [Pseudoclavibacter sp.]|jgi:early secretory antigenic target protein ESAT-6
MESFAVTPEQVNSLSAEIARGADGIRNELETLDSQVKQLIGSWDGAAQQSYHVAQVEWNKSLSEIQQLLQTISQKTAEISSTYVSSDNSSAKRFSF